MSSKDEQLRSKGTEALAGVGLPLSNATRILLTCIVSKGGLPAGKRAIRLAMMHGFAPRSWGVLGIMPCPIPM